jgi:hypothetical protein
MKKTWNEILIELDEEDMRSALKEVWGRRLIWRLMSRCGVFQQTLVPGSFELTGLNEGKRSIGLTLLKQVMDINPEAYQQMVKANKKEEKYGRQLESRPEPDATE